MKTKKLLVLDGNGLSELTLQMRPLEIEDNIINSLSSAVVRQTSNVFWAAECYPEGKGTVTLRASASMVGLTIPLTHLQLRCPFIMNSSKELHPCFDGTSSAPKLSLKWFAPPKMVLSLVLILRQSYAEIQNHYLVAEHTDYDRVLYRLPLPNLYENAVLCAGKYPLTHDSYLSAARAACRQFYNSEWNSDLYGRGAHDVEGPARLFKFKPKGETEMAQINDLEDWRKVCTTVSDSTLEMYYAN